MKVGKSGSLSDLTAEEVPNVGALAKMFRKRRKFASPSVLEWVIERLNDASPEEREVAEELLLRLKLNPHDGRTALVLSRCIMEGGSATASCLKKLASMPQCSLKNSLLDCVVRSLSTHQEEAKEALKTYPWKVLLPYLVSEVLLDPRKGERLKSEVVRFLEEERDSIASSLPDEPTELTELLVKASKAEVAREAVMGILKAWLRKRERRSSLLEKLRLTKPKLANPKDFR